MLQCTSVTELPLMDAIAQLVVRDGDPLWADEMIPCELGALPDHEHAGLVGDCDSDQTVALWLTWTEDGHQVVWLPWCQEDQPSTDDACGLFHSHPSGHSWQVTDPTRDALRTWLQQVWAEKPGSDA